MIIGIGVDIIEKERVKRAYEKDSFRRKYYTAAEQAEIAEHPHKAASDFAVKEALVKAVGTGFGKIMPGQIEVLREESGRPYVTLHEQARVVQQELGITQVHVSISDTDTFTVAYVVCEGKPDSQGEREPQGQ